MRNLRLGDLHLIVWERCAPENVFVQRQTLAEVPGQQLGPKLGVFHRSSRSPPHPERIERIENRPGVPGGRAFEKRIFNDP